MELFALILIILACVMFTSVLDQLIPHLSLPLIQIAAGLIVALIYPSLGGVNIDSELFLVLFIAPLLYRDSREVSRVTLWNNKWSILSMAIPLVIATVVATGFVLHQIIPSIQLAAAFACAAALGPTDAAAVLCPQLTVIRQPFEELAEKTVDSMMALLRGETPAPRILLDTLTVVQGTTTRA